MSRQVIQILILGILGYVSVPFLLAGEKQKYGYARENELLRTYFEPICYHQGTDKFTYKRWGREVEIPATGGTNSVFFEQCIDRQIDHYVSEIEKKLEQLQADLADIHETREQCEKLSGRERIKEAFLLFREPFDRLKKNSNEVYSDLRRVFTSLKNKEDFDLLVTPESRKLCYSDEITLLQLHLELADRKITEYFFGPQVVKANELGSSNMLLTLFRIREIASRLERP
jgi:hypothetical protein